MQELTPASLANMFTELEKATDKLIFVVFKTEASMMDFFNAITDAIHNGELSDVFNERTNNLINMMLLDEFLECRWKKPDYILYERGVGVEAAFIVESHGDDADELDIFLNEFSRRK